MNSSSSSPPTADVVVVGGGLMGRSSAWRLAAGGLDVVLVVGETAAAASTVAAGMLAPVTETTFTEELLLGLNLASMRRYPTFSAEVEEASGLPSGFRAGPTLSVAYNADDAARMATLAGYLDRLGLESARLTSREARKIEPLLAPTIRGGLLVPGDASCDNRQLLAALTVAGERVRVRTVSGFVHHVASADDRVAGVVLADGSTIAAPTVVLANGAWAGQVTGIPGPGPTGQGSDPATRPRPVPPTRRRRPRLHPGHRDLPRAARRWPRAGGRRDGRGARFRPPGDGGRVYELLRDARLAIPMSAEYVLAETSVGYRPGTPDNAPILGRGALDGLVLATGHYRNGVLLTPITADVVAELVLHDRVPAVAAPFGPERFETLAASARTGSR